MRKPANRALVTGLTVTVFGSVPVWAQSRAWEWTDVDQNALWSDANNWAGGLVPGTAAEVALFGNSALTTSGTWDIAYDLAAGTVIDGVQTQTSSNDFSAATTIRVNSTPTNQLLIFDNNIQRGSMTNLTSLIFNIDVEGTGSLATITGFTGNNTLIFNGALRGDTQFRFAGNNTINFNGANQFTQGFVFRGADTQAVTAAFGNVDGLVGTSGTIAWDGGNNAAGGTLNFIHASGTAVVNNALDFGDTSSTGNADVLRFQANRGLGVNFTTNSIDSGSGDLFLRLGANNSGSGLATFEFSGASFDVTRQISLGTGGTNGNNVDLRFGNTSGVQTFRDITDTSGGTGTRTITRAGVGGTTILNGTDSSTAAINVTGGTLQVGNGGLTGSIGNKDVNFGGGSANGRRLTFNRSDSFIYGGVVSGAGDFEKSGAGSLTLTGAQTYTGTTFISGGVLIIDSTGSLASTTLNLGTGGTFDAAAKSSFAMNNLVGTGTIEMGGGTFTVAESLSVGNSPGAISVNGDLTLTSTTTTTMELASTLGVAGTDFDQISVSGVLTLEGALAVVSWNGFNIDQFGTYDLFDFGSVTGNFDSVMVGGTALAFDSIESWTGTGTGGWQYGFNVNTGVLTVVPEPVVPGLVSLAALGLLRRRRTA